MKKFLSALFLSFCILVPFASCKEEKSNVIRLNEVTHSVFYAPLYVAVENGYFDKFNIEISLTNGGGADKVMTAVLSKNADIGLMGPETVIYVKSQGKDDCPLVFSQLTKKDGAFLVSRKNEPNFTLNDLRGKDILAGRQGGVPAMSFEYVLARNGMANGVDYTLNFGVQFNLMTPAFESGTGDYCTMFEPTASEYAKAGKGYIVCSMGDLSGEIPYTSFVALTSFMKKNETTVKNFNKAIKMGLDFIYSHTSSEVANAIKKQFVGTSIESLSKSVESYKNIDAWANDLTPTEKMFDNLQNIMIFSNVLTEKIPFGSLTDLNYL